MKKIRSFLIIVTFFCLMVLPSLSNAQRNLLVISDNLDWKVTYTYQYSHTSKWTQTCSLDLYDFSFYLTNTSDKSIKFNNFYIYRTREYCNEYASFYDENRLRNFVLEPGKDVWIKITTAVPAGNGAPSEWNYRIN